MTPLWVRVSFVAAFLASTHTRQRARQAAFGRYLSRNAELDHAPSYIMTPELNIC